MEQVTKKTEQRNLRIFDVVIAIFVTALSVVVILQANKLESLRYEVKLHIKETKIQDNFNALYKGNILISFNTDLCTFSRAESLHNSRELN